MEKKYKKRSFALLVGCNYPNTEYELHGCVNDVLAMRDTLEKRFGFDRSRIELLSDDPGSKTVAPTGENIKKALGDMIDKAKAGDVLYFHYSGHGTRIRSKKNSNHKDEAIVPSDYNLVTDVDFRNLVNRLPEGASLTMLSDSCHSGGLIEKEKEQIGPQGSKEAAFEEIEIESDRRTKSIPADSLLKHLSSLTNISTAAGVGTLMLELFGSAASLAFTGDREVAHLKPDEGILLSGCQADENSADVGSGKKARGAFSSAVMSVLEEANKGPFQLSNREVVVRARKMLKDKGFAKQHPCLYCSDRNADAVFLSDPSSS